MSDENFDKAAAVALLNDILETELAGVVRYTHYSLMVFGHSRIPIVSWLRGEATTCLAHANEAGEIAWVQVLGVRNLTSARMLERGGNGERERRRQADDNYEPSAHSAVLLLFTGLAL